MSVIPWFVITVWLICGVQWLFAGYSNENTCLRAGGLCALSHRCCSLFCCHPLSFRNVNVSITLRSLDLQAGVSLYQIVVFVIKTALYRLLFWISCNDLFLSLLPIFIHVKWSYYNLDVLCFVLEPFAACYSVMPVFLGDVYINYFYEFPIFYQANIL